MATSVVAHCCWYLITEATLADVGRQARSSDPLKIINQKANETRVK